MDTNILQVKLISDARSGITVFVPILNIIIGGMLTMAGGYLVHFWTTRRDKKKLAREKLENLFVLTCRLKEWAGYEYAETTCAIAKSKPSSPKVADPTNELVMLARLYHPCFSEDAIGIQRHANELQKCCYSMIVDVASHDNQTDNSTRIAKICDCMNELFRASEILQGRIAQAIQKLV